MSDFSGAPVETSPATVRCDRRPDPRLATAGAGAGCALAVLGVLTVAFDALDGGGDGDGGSQAPGIILSALVLAAGLFLLARGPGDAFRTAGSVATTLSIPPLLFFLTFNEDSFPPYSTEAMLGVSAAAWIALHLVGPAAGRTFPLGAGLIAAWLFVLQIVEEPFTSPFDLFRVFVETGFEAEDDASFGRGFDAPDLTTMGFISLLFGIGVLVVANRLDGRGQRGRATAFAAAGIVMLPVGVVLLADDLEATGTGLLAVVIGTGLAVLGALAARRGTTWVGGALILAGAAAVVGDLFDSATSFGVAAAVVGAGIVAGAHFGSAALGEPPELTPGPSTFTRPVQGSSPPTEF